MEPAGPQPEDDAALRVDVDAGRLLGQETGVAVRRAGDELAEPHGLFLVARVHGDIAGGVGLRRIGDPTLRLAEIKRLWVRPDLLRGGIAASLMGEIEARAASLGYERLYLETGPKQPESVALYVTIGWDRIEDYPSDVFCHPMSHRFTKPL